MSRKPRRRRTNFAFFLFLSFAFLFVALIVVQHVQIARWIGSSSSSSSTINTATISEDYKLSLKNDNVRQHDDGICSVLESHPKIGLPFTSSSLWIKHQSAILSASRHPRDEHFVHRKWMEPVLSSLSPSMLRKGTITTPSYQAMKRVIDIVSKRLAHMENPTDENDAPPLKIAVLGGSVTEGRGCNNLRMKRHNQRYNKIYYPKPSVKEEKNIPPAKCAWPFQFENLVNNVVGKKVIEVTNMSIGGTNTGLATPLIKYWLYPRNLLPDGPDVILLSYSTNESLRIDESPQQHAANMRNRLQAFISEVQESRPCDDPPLLLILDDYIGLQQDNILEEMTYDKIMTELSHWYDDIMAISYANVIRKLVYADTHDAMFSAPWYGNKGNPKIQVHFGLAGHMAIAWTLAFGTLEAINRYCDDDAFHRRYENRGVIPQNVTELVENVPPPALTDELTLSNTTRDWHDKRDHRTNRTAACTTDPFFGKSPCLFAFIAGPSGTVQTPKMLMNYLELYIQKNDGWGGEDDISAGWSRRLGLVPLRQNATLVLRLTDIRQEVKKIYLQTLKSYGDGWAESRARFTVWIEANGTRRKSAEFEIEGMHDSTTSITYPFELDLMEQKALKGSDVSLEVRLVGGSLFKIIGMMLCDR